MRSGKKPHLREETQYLDDKITRVFATLPDVTMKIAALLMRLHYQRVYRATHRISKSSTDTRRKIGLKL
jgi:hypothetical protein